MNKQLLKIKDLINSKDIKEDNLFLKTIKSILNSKYPKLMFQNSLEVLKLTEVEYKILYEAFIKENYFKLYRVVATDEELEDLRLESDLIECKINQVKIESTIKLEELRHKEVVNKHTEAELLSAKKQDMSGLITDIKKLKKIDIY